jgi:hypothetical protein
MTCSSVNHDFFIAPPGPAGPVDEATLTPVFSCVEKVGRRQLPHQGLSGMLEMSVFDPKKSLHSMVLALACAPN